MNVVCDVLQLLSVASLGIFAGAMLTEGCVLVPWWRSLSAADFLAWYAANDQRLLDFFSPLTSVMALFAVAAAVASFWTGQTDRWASLLAAVLSLAIVSTFFLYFKNANARFSESRIEAGEVPAALGRWAAWHWSRTLMSLVALSAALFSLSI
jgi:hypothetical protein